MIKVPASSLGLSLTTFVYKCDPRRMWPHKLFYQSLPLGGYYYITLQAWSPHLFSLLFWLLGQRYVLRESYGGSQWVSVGFSYCTWSSRLEKTKSQKNLQQN